MRPSMLARSAHDTRLVPSDRRTGAEPAVNPRWRQIATTIQPKLAVSAPDDPYEREADRVADHVMRMAEPQLQRACSACSGASIDEEKIQRRADRGVGPAEAADGIAARIGTGRPLEPDVRRYFEPRYGVDFSAVRVHADSSADAAARRVNALAFTLGRDLVFRSGQYAPHSGPGRRLLAHELTHVVQQRASGARVQRQQPTQTQATATVGTTAAFQTFCTRPQDEPDPILRAAMGLWSRYRPQVRIEQVRFEILTSTTSRLGHSLSIGGLSHWDGTTPVIEVPQAILDDVAAYVAVRGTAPASAGITAQPAGGVEDLSTRSGLAPLERAHEAVRLVGHELHHLWRERSGHAGNPIYPVYEAEVQRRMAQVHQNWLDFILNGGSSARRTLGIPLGTTIRRWEDIPANVRQSIEQGAAQTDPFEGFFQRSAYLVEEIYTKIEELSYLRVQQRDATPSVQDPSRWEVSGLAHEIYVLHNILQSVADPSGPVTPALVAQADRDMLTYLRSRFPSSQGSQFDSYEVVFFLNAIRGGLPPLYSGGRLISVPPPDARLPP